MGVAVLEEDGNESLMPGGPIPELSEEDQRAQVVPRALVTAQRERYEQKCAMRECVSERVRERGKRGSEVECIMERKGGGQRNCYTERERDERRWESEDSERR